MSEKFQYVYSLYAFISSFFVSFLFAIILTESSIINMLIQIIKISKPLLIVLLASFLITRILCWWVFTLNLSLEQAFKSTPKTDWGGISLKLKGVAGDSAIVGFNPFSTGSSSEELLLSPKTVEEIRSSFSDADLDRWKFLTGLSPSLFQFNLLLVSNNSSPNNGKKKCSYFSVNIASDTAIKVLPGQKVYLKRGLKVDDLAQTISSIKISFIDDFPIYDLFYDQDGKFVSQATGRIIVTPTWTTQVLIFFGAWVFIIALLALIKQTLFI